MIRVMHWDDAQTKKEISQRFRYAQEARSQQEEKWIRNERAIYSVSSSLSMGSLQNSLESNFNIGLPSVDGSSADVNIAYTFKNFRYIHAQMSSNPPSVVMRPQTSDQDDQRKADAADRIVRYSIRHYNMQEKIDQLSLHALLYGTGICKTIWDSTRGSILKYNEQTDEVVLEGDISITVPFIWNLYLDPDAKAYDEIRFVIERVFIDYEEACLRWPSKEEVLKKAKVERKGKASDRGRNTQLQDDHYNCVELLEYWETGLPANGYLGRYCLTTTEGDVLESCRPSPFRFRQPGAVSLIEDSDLQDDEKEKLVEKLPEQAQLPFHVLTDIDIPNMVWGRSFVEYASQLQDNVNRLDTAVLDNIQAHGVARLVIPESADIADDGLSNSPWDVTKISGNQPPYFMKPPELMPDMTSLRTNHVQGIDHVSGVNENMFGQQSREQAMAAMQFATNQGNMVRRRLFNKYVLVTESIYRAILNLIRKHWTTGRTIHVLGKEKALEAVDVKGMDIDGGYDVVGEYGVSLSLDPMTRRQEILTLQPLFEKAGVPERTSLRMMKLNELEGMYDELDLADTRQKEIFDQMIATGMYIKPRKYRDHVNMIAFGMRYFMSQEFESLSENIQALLERHIEERAQTAAMEKNPPVPGGTSPASAGMQPPGAPGPVPGAPAGEPPAPGGQPQPQAG